MLRVYNNDRYLKHVTQIEDVDIGCNAESIEDTVASPNIIDNIKVIAVDI